MQDCIVVVGSHLAICRRTASLHQRMQSHGRCIQDQLHSHCMQDFRVVVSGHFQLQYLVVVYSQQSFLVIVYSLCVVSHSHCMQDFRVVVSGQFQLSYLVVVCSHFQSQYIVVVCSHIAIVCRILQSLYAVTWRHSIQSCHILTQPW